MQKGRPKRDYRDSEWPKGLRKSPSGFYWQRMVGGRRLKFSFARLSQPEAIARALDLNAQIRAGVNVEAKGRQAATTFWQFAEDDFLAEKKATTRRTSHARYRAICEHFHDFLHKHHSHVRSIRDVSEEVAEAYKRHRLTTEVSPNGKEGARIRRNGVKPCTLWTELNTLRSIFRRAKSRGLVEANPFERVTVSKRQFKKSSPHRVLSEREVTSLLQAAREYDAELLQRYGDHALASLHDAFLVLVKTGLRDGELRHLQWADIDFDSSRIQVRAKKVTETRRCEMLPHEVSIWTRLVKGKKAGEHLFSEMPRRNGMLSRIRVRREEDLLSLKARDIDVTAGTIRLHKTYEWKPKASERAIPLSPKLAQVLSERKRRFGERSSFVFPSPDGGKCRLHLLDQLRTLCRKAEIAEPFPRIHDLRHTFAATLRRKGVPLEVIMGVMRHADLKETLLYAPFEEREGRSAVAELDKLF